MGLFLSPLSESSKWEMMNDWDKESQIKTEVAEEVKHTHTQSLKTHIVETSVLFPVYSFAMAILVL